MDRIRGRTGSDRVFLDLDMAERRSYEQRAQTATGVLPAPDHR